MKSGSPSVRRIGMASVVALGVAVGWIALVDRPLARAQDTAGLPGSVPSAEGEPLVELAPYMGELQRLHHKLALSVRHRNPKLAEFYLYESLESVADIQEEVPEYRGQPVALFLDQIAKPHYDALQEELRVARESGDADATWAKIDGAMVALTESCNQCHAATLHGFIKIVDPGDTNPFNQDFRP